MISVSHTDVIFSDVGTSSMGIVNVNLPTRARVHFQHLWGEPILRLFTSHPSGWLKFLTLASIGWSGGAVLGGAVRPVKRILG
jgi:hypothetical protein